MYDGSDVALALGAILSGFVACVFAILFAFALAMLFVRRSPPDPGRTRRYLRRAATFGIAAILCGLSIPSGYFVYDLFEHHRGHQNPPSHALAVAIASSWGPIAAAVWGLGSLLIGTREPRNCDGAESGIAKIQPND